MAKLSQIKIKNIDLFSNGKIDWTKFKNTPSTLVSASGHNHDDLYYRTDVVDTAFQEQKDRLEILENRIAVLSYKTDVFMGGGESDNTAIDNYNFDNETSQVINLTLLNPSYNTPSISSIDYGYFISTNKTCSKLDRLSLTNTEIQEISFDVKGSLIDFATQRTGYVNDGINKWFKLNTTMNVWEQKPDTSVESSGRNQLSSTLSGFTKGNDFGTVREYTYSSGTGRVILDITAVGETVGLNNSSKKGLWLSGINGNFEHYYVTDTIQQFNTMVYSANGASTSTTDTYGIILGCDTSGDKVQKINWVTLSISQATNLTVNKNNASTIEF